MSEFPTVKYFCGCCDLKVSCIAIASFRMITAIIVFAVVLIPILVSLCVKEHSASKRHRDEFPIIEFLLFMYGFIQYLVIFINIFASYNFILGVTSVRRVTYINL